MTHVTQDQFVEILKAQAKHAAALLTDEHWLVSDDGLDYATGACSLFSAISKMGLEQFEELINRRGSIIQEYACDGICQEIYDLKSESTEFED